MGGDVARLGLWGGPDAPFPTREAFMDAVETGGVAVMELIARELKAMECTPPAAGEALYSMSQN